MVIDGGLTTCAYICCCCNSRLATPFLLPAHRSTTHSRYTVLLTYCPSSRFALPSAMLLPPGSSFCGLSLVRESRGTLRPRMPYQICTVAFVGVISNIHTVCVTAKFLAWICTLPKVVVGIISVSSSVAFSRPESDIILRDRVSCPPSCSRCS